MLTFHDTGKEFELKVGLLKMITNKNFNVDLASLSDKKLLFDFAKELIFVVKTMGNRSTGDRTLIKLLKSPGLIVSASGISNALFLPSGLDDLCDRLKLLLQKNQEAGNNSGLIKEEIVVILDKLLEEKSISKKQHKQILIKCNLLHTTKK